MKTLLLTLLVVALPGVARAQIWLECPYDDACPGADVRCGETCVPLQPGAPEDPAYCPPQGQPFDLVACQGTASTIYVHGAAPPGGTGAIGAPLQTIVQGIAAVAPGGTVCVGVGDYPEDVVVTKPLRLIGACPAQTRILAHSVGISVIEVANVQLRRLTVRGASQWGILALYAPWLGIRDVIAERNAGANVFVNGTNPVGAPPASACLPAQPAAAVEICDSTLRRARSGGAGLWVQESQDVRVERCRISRNGGTGALLVRDDVRVTGTIIDGNRRAIHIRDPREDILIRNCDIKSSNKGGLLARNTMPTMPPAHLTVRANAIRSNRGGGVAAGNSAGLPSAARMSMDMVSNELLANSAYGVYWARVPGALADNEIALTLPRPGFGPGRGVEIHSAEALVMAGNDVLLSADAGVLIRPAPGAVAAIELTGGSIASNGGYGLSIQGNHASPGSACVAPAVVAGAAIDVTGVAIVGNGGTGIHLEDVSAAVRIVGNGPIGATETLIDPLSGPIRYGVSACGATVGIGEPGAPNIFVSTLTGAIVLQGASGGVGPNTYQQGGFQVALLGEDGVGAASDPAVSLFDPTVTSGSDGVAIPMPCPLMPVSEALILSGL